MERIYKRTLLFIAVTLLLSGCTNDSHEEAVIKKIFKREWYELVKTDTLSAEKMSQEIMGSSISFGRSMVRNSFRYHSINGSDTLTLSGAICWPLGAILCSEIWFENHYFNTRWDECPSQQAQPGMLISSIRNAIYIGADYQGFGLSTNYNIPYLNTILLASQSIDCFKAAMTFLKDYGPNIDDEYHTYNIGYSLGGAVAMGVARQTELDSEFKEFIHLKGTLCGGGPYDQVAYFNNYLEAPNSKLDYPVAFLCAIRSITNSSPSFKQKYDDSDCFSAELLNSGILDALDSKNYSTDEINQMLSDNNLKSIEKILSAELLERNSQINKDVFKEIEKLDLTSGWMPQIPIRVRHSRTDTYVPFACMESVMTNWLGYPNVTFEIIESATHNEDGANFYKQIAFGSYSLD